MLIFDIYNIKQIINDKWLDWYIENTKWIIKRYSSYDNNKANRLIVDKYSRLLWLLGLIQKNQHKNIEQIIIENKEYWNLYKKSIKK